MHNVYVSCSTVIAVCGSLFAAAEAREHLFRYVCARLFAIQRSTGNPEIDSTLCSIAFLPVIRVDPTLFSETDWVRESDPYIPI